MGLRQCYAEKISPLISLCAFAYLFFLLLFGALLIAQSSEQIPVLAFDTRELPIYSGQRHSRHRKVPSELFKLFSKVGLSEELRAVTCVHLVDCISKIGIIEIRDIGLR